MSQMCSTDNTAIQKGLTTLQKSATLGREQSFKPIRTTEVHGLFKRHLLIPKLLKTCLRNICCATTILTSFPADSADFKAILPETRTTNLIGMFTLSQTSSNNSSLQRLLATTNLALLYLISTIYGSQEAVHVTGVEFVGAVCGHGYITVLCPTMDRNESKGTILCIHQYVTILVKRQRLSA